MGGYFWYKSLLDGDEAEAYTEISSGLLSMEQEIKVPELEYRRISEIYSMVKLDRPEIFYAAEPVYRSRMSSEHISVVPKYLFNEKQISRMKEALSVRLERILRPAFSLDEIKAVEFVRSFVFENVRYDKLEKNYSHEVYGVLSHGIGVCEGISKTVKLMLDRLGIESIVAIGSENEDHLRHAWNMINLHGKMKHYDLTFDLSRREKGLKPKYASMTDEAIFRDHNKPVFRLPEAM